MKISIDIDELLWKKIADMAGDNERSVSGEIRFQLSKIYGGKK